MGDAEKMEVAKIMNKYEVKWVHLDTHNKPLDVLNFKKKKEKKKFQNWIININIEKARELATKYDPLSK